METSPLIPIRPSDAELIRIAINSHLVSAGITITASEATDLAMHRELCLRDNERIEFGTPAVVAIAKELAPSSCLKICDTADALTRLQEVFYRTRNELSVEVPDTEIVEAICHCFDEMGSAFDVAALPTEELMAFSKTYQQAQESTEEACYRRMDDPGRTYTFDPTEWDYDETAPGWNGEKWDDDIDE